MLQNLIFVKYNQNLKKWHDSDEKIDMMIMVDPNINVKYSYLLKSYSTLNFSYISSFLFLEIIVHKTCTNKRKYSYYFSLWNKPSITTTILKWDAYLQ